MGKFWPAMRVVLLGVFLSLALLASADDSTVAPTTSVDANTTAATDGSTTVTEAASTTAEGATTATAATTAPSDSNATTTTAPTNETTVSGNATTAAPSNGTTTVSSGGNATTTVSSGGNATATPAPGNATTVNGTTTSSNVTTTTVAPTSVPSGCPRPTCKMPTCKDDEELEARVGREYFLDKAGNGTTICRRIHCPRCLPKTECTDVKPACETPSCPAGQEEYETASAIRKDGTTGKRCRVKGCKKCRRCLNDSTCKVSPCPTAPPPVCNATHFLVHRRGRNGCPATSVCRPKKCPQRKCKPLPRKCPEGHEKHTPPARKVLRGGGTYSCLWQPCARCRELRCPKYACSYVRCRRNEERYTPRDKKGCAMCESCRPVASVDRYDDVEDEADDDDM